MNTGFRRFILRLAVGLLAFMLGITAAWALGGFNPFQNFSGTRHYKQKKCSSYRSWNAPPPALDSPRAPAVMTELVLITPHGGKVEENLGKLHPLPPLPPQAPAPPTQR